MPPRKPSTGHVAPSLGLGHRGGLPDGPTDAKRERRGPAPSARYPQRGGEGCGADQHSRLAELQRKCKERGGPREGTATPLLGTHWTCSSWISNRAETHQRCPHVQTTQRAPRDQELNLRAMLCEDGALVRPQGTAFAVCFQRRRVLARHPPRDPVTSLPGFPGGPSTRSLLTTVRGWVTPVLPEVTVFPYASPLYSGASILASL